LLSLYRRRVQFHPCRAHAGALGSLHRDIDIWRWQNSSSGWRSGEARHLEPKDGTHLLVLPRTADGAGCQAGWRAVERLRLPREVGGGRMSPGRLPVCLHARGGAARRLGRSAVDDLHHGSSGNARRRGLRGQDNG
jgi:hypothetical protein